MTAPLTYILGSLIVGFMLGWFAAWVAGAFREYCKGGEGP